jgi:hypothetical protein
MPVLQNSGRLLLPEFSNIFFHFLEAHYMVGFSSRNIKRAEMPHSAKENHVMLFVQWSWQ